jgi:hypothetical protein
MDVVPCVTCIRTAPLSNWVVKCPSDGSSLCKHTSDACVRAGHSPSFEGVACAPARLLDTRYAVGLQQAVTRTSQPHKKSLLNNCWTCDVRVQCHSTNAHVNISTVNVCCCV